MTAPDRLAAAVAQGHEDAVQVGPKEDGVMSRLLAKHREDVDAYFAANPCSDLCPEGPHDEHVFTPAPVSPPAGEDVQGQVDAMRFYNVENGDFDSDESPAGEDVAESRSEAPTRARDSATKSREGAAWSALDRPYHPPQVAGQDVERVAREELCRLIDHLNATEASAKGWPTDPLTALAVLVECARPDTHHLDPDAMGAIVLAALSARPVEAQEVERVHGGMSATYWYEQTLARAAAFARVRKERDAALARVEALRAGIADLAAEGEAWGVGVAVELSRRLRALLDGDSEGRESRAALHPTDTTTPEEG